MIWGDPAADHGYSEELLRSSDGAPVHLMARFDESEKSAILAGLDALIVPSIGLESFGIVAREAMRLGTPVIASRLGALAELDIDPHSGALFEAGSTRELGKILRHLVDHPDTIDRWRSQLPRIISSREHAREINAIYDSVLE